MCMEIGRAATVVSCSAAKLTVQCLLFCTNHESSFQPFQYVVYLVVPCTTDSTGQPHDAFGFENLESNIHVDQRAFRRANVFTLGSSRRTKTA